MLGFTSFGKFLFTLELGKWQNLVLHALLHWYFINTSFINFAHSFSLRIALTQTLAWSIHLVAMVDTIKIVFNISLHLKFWSILYIFLMIQIWSSCQDCSHFQLTNMFLCKSFVRQTLSGWPKTLNCYWFGWQLICCLQLMLWYLVYNFVVLMALICVARFHLTSIFLILMRMSRTLMNEWIVSEILKIFCISTPGFLRLNIYPFDLWNFLSIMANFFFR